MLPHQMIFSLSSVSPVWFLMRFKAWHWGTLILRMVKRRDSHSLFPCVADPSLAELRGPQRLLLQQLKTLFCPRAPWKGPGHMPGDREEPLQEYRGFCFGFQVEGRMQTLLGRLRNPI